MDVLFEAGLPADDLLQIPGFRLAASMDVSTIAELESWARGVADMGFGWVSCRRQQVRRLGPDNVARILRDHNLRVATLGFAGGFTGTLNQSYLGAIQDLRGAIRLGTTLNARALIVLTGGRGLHTHNHAVGMIRDGLESCVREAGNLRLKLLVPTLPILNQQQESYIPASNPIDWVTQFGYRALQPLICATSSADVSELPAGWQESLICGAMLRIRTTAASNGYRQVHLVAPLIERLAEELNACLISAL